MLPVPSAPFNSAIGLAAHTRTIRRTFFLTAPRQYLIRVASPCWRWSTLILQPGPAALTDGLAELERIIGRWATRQDEP